MQTLRDIIGFIHAVNDPDQKGRLFELLCLYFLRHDKLQQELFSDTWLWRDSPISNGQPDTGIDIVAKISGSDSYCAVQCKFRGDDSSITKSEIDSFLALSSKSAFSQRILFTLSDNLNANARNALVDQSPNVRLLTLQALNDSSIDWSAFSFDDPQRVRYNVKTLRDHQVRAVNDVLSGFAQHDRGKLIMACGTGKTFTSLKIAERLAGKGSLVLVLVPSISLLNQTLLAWSYDHDDAIPLVSFAVCSDSTVGRYPAEDLRPSELALPPTTDAQSLVDAFTPNDSMTVIFSTYQSLQVIHDAQSLGLPQFGLVICDEAHRTSGIALTEREDSYFRLVHNDFIKAQKRLYMTATPKIFTENAKSKAKDENIILCSMDDEKIFGPEFHRLSFSRAVEGELLTDYKVMIFMVEKDNPDEPDLPAKIRAVSKALAKQIAPEDFDFIQDDPAPMHRAVAFSNTIADSKDFTLNFEAFADQHSPVKCSTRHIDGKDPAAKRSASLMWLKDSANPDSCRILSNARCLCEGVDVPALDAIVFLNPRSSEIDIVQSVGRVMRKAEGKKFGYVILPVIVKPGESPEHALDNNDSYRTVWRVLQALRALDDHFNAEVNSLDFSGKSSRVRPTHDRATTSKGWFNEEMAEKYRQEIYIRMVRKCGDREYWKSWVQDLVGAFRQISTRINEAIPSVKEDFDSFTEELCTTINPSITREQAVEMLAQHITSKEVFDSIFTGFAGNNPISKSMENMRALLTANGADLDPRGLAKFNEHVREKAASATTGLAKQKLLREIYENFFVQAFPETAKTLGIVYTPEEIVDFILRSADWALREKLGIAEGLSAEGVNILDPFSGTGTFTARLLHLKLLGENFPRKYMKELCANEILLLAYYISAVNIEAAYTQEAGGFYKEFPGMVLGDTFRLGSSEGETPVLSPMFLENSERAEEQRKADINVIVGNPPYSVGGKSADYEKVDGRIAGTYARRSTARNKNSLYDSYIRAIRWASDRIEDRGIVCYVSNGSFIDSNSADGMRKCLAEEFTNIYVFNLRGNANTSGETRRNESGNVFGDGTKCPIAITLFVKNGTKNRCEIWYSESDDYMTREEKLEEVKTLRDFGLMMRMGHMTLLVPNKYGDWINQRWEAYYLFWNLGNKREDRPAIFGERYSRGVVSGHDAYSFNFSREALCENMRALNPEAFSEEFVRIALYSPYVKMMTHFSHETNIRVYQMPRIFPKPDTKNLVICVSGIGSKNFSVLMTDTLPSLTVVATCQCFPLFWYEEVSSSLFGTYTERRDGIGDETLTLFRLHYRDGRITKEDIFCYIYGVLSSREYGERFGRDTRRVLARVPLAGNFWAFSEAGRELGRLHVGYEGVEGWPLEVCGDESDLRLRKMRVVNEGGERVIRYNDGLTLRGIPAVAWEYEVNGRSALEWLVERYTDSVDVKSGLRNDGNAWGRERGNERYVIELIGRIVRVSVETERILSSLPELGV